jgi:hypothetical protein
MNLNVMLLVVMTSLFFFYHVHVNVLSWQLLYIYMNNVQTPIIIRFTCPRRCSLPCPKKVLFFTLLFQTLSNNFSNIIRWMLLFKSSPLLFSTSTLKPWMDFASGLWARQERGRDRHARTRRGSSKRRSFLLLIGWVDESFPRDSHRLEDPTTYSQLGNLPATKLFVWPVASLWALGKEKFRRYIDRHSRSAELTFKSINVAGTLSQLQHLGVVGFLHDAAAP